MITFDDLNDWSSVLGGYAGTVYTPNLERIAAQGTTFTGAFCTTPGCNPSRSSTLTGMGPLTTGVVGNDELLFDYADPSVTLPAVLKDAGFTTVTSGKVFHKLPNEVAPLIYTDVLSGPGEGDGNGERPTAVTPTATTVRAGVYTGPLEDLDDIKNTNAAIDFLEGYKPQEDSPGLFLSVGITRPHEPHIAPQEFFDLYPLEDIVLPETLPDDLNDIPGFADYFGNPAEFDRTRLAGEWPAFVQAYLAAVSFADWMLGNVLDAIAASAIGQDTIIALWSDHGFHLGEKQHVGKFTLWEEAARSNLIIAAPGNEGIAGARIDTPVSLLDLYPTLLDYADVPIPAWAEGQSLREVIATGEDEYLRGNAITSIGGSHSLRTPVWRYTRYADGSEELYDMRRDPEAFDNLADVPAFADRKAALADRLERQLDTQPFLQNLSGKAVVLDASVTGERVLVAGNAGDTLIGGARDNSFLLDDATVTIVEQADGGLDIAVVSNSYTLPEHVEQLRFSPSGATVGTPTLVGNASDNLIVVPVGRAIVFGAEGNDTLTSEGGADELNGGAGDDSLESGSGNDVLDGGAGDDRHQGGSGDDRYRLSLGRDVITERPGFGFDVVDTTAWGGLDGVRVVTRYVAGVLTSLVLEQVDGTATTTISVSAGAPGIEALTDATTTRLLVAGSVVGGNDAETLLGSGGADVLQARDGGDRLDGSGGDDVLEGGDGDDTLLGGEGDDRILGGRGTDTADYGTASAGVAVRLNIPGDEAQATGLGTDRLTDIENLVGGSFADQLTGQGKDNRLVGGDGSDTLSGLGGSDVLVGGAGADLLKGGTGADRFIFTLADLGAGTDRIADFAIGDLIDLSALDRNPDTVRRDPLQLRPNGNGGEVRISIEGDTTRIEVSIGDDPTAIVIVLGTALDLRAADFVF